MAVNNNHSFKFDSFDLIKYLYNKRKPLIIITVIGAIVSIIVSLIIEPKFQSTAIIFPAQYSSASSIILGQNFSREHVLKFGEEEEVERMLQILRSSLISDEIIRKYDLFKHYKISTDNKYKYTSLYKKYEDNITYKKTKFMSIQIDVLDTDPVMAANIANDIVDLVDTAYNQIRKQQAQKTLEIVTQEYNELQKHIRFLEDSIKKVQAFGINEYEGQAERFNEAYAYAVTEGRNKGAKELEKKISILSEYGVNYMSMRDLLIYERDKLSQLRTKLMYAKVDANNELSFRFVVNRAAIAEKKTYPKRSIIVIASTVSSFLLALLLLVFIDNIKRVVKE